MARIHRSVSRTPRSLLSTWSRSRRCERTDARGTSSLAGYEQWLVQQPPGGLVAGPGTAPRPSAEPPVVPLAIVETPLPRVTTTIPLSPTRQAASVRRRSGRRRRNRWLPRILGCLAALLCLIAGFYVLHRSLGIAEVEPGDLPAGQVARATAIPGRGEFRRRCGGTERDG